jgi:hypothetical protein
MEGTITAAKIIISAIISTKVSMMYPPAFRCAGSFRICEFNIME